MPKVVISPSLRWPGQISVSSPLNLPQALAWEKAIRTAQAVAENGTLTDYNYAVLPGIIACVEKWELEGIGDPTPDTFPASPRKASIELITWLMTEVSRVYVGEEEKADPNE